MWGKLRFTDKGLAVVGTLVEYGQFQLLYVTVRQHARVTCPSRMYRFYIITPQINVINYFTISMVIEFFDRLASNHSLCRRTGPTIAHVDLERGLPLLVFEATPSTHTGPDAPATLAATPATTVTAGITCRPVPFSGRRKLTQRSVCIVSTQGSNAAVSDTDSEGCAPRTNYGSHDDDG
jgi:hypothetical protein